MRLVIEYFLIGLLIAVGALAVSTKMTSLKQENHISELEGSLNVAEGKIEVIEGVNKSQGEVIVRLGEQREMDGKAIVELMDSYQELSLADNKARQRLRSLEKTDENARTYFAVPVPDSVACVYDDSCPPTQSGSPNGDYSPYPAKGDAKGLLLAPET